MYIIGYPTILPSFQQEPDFIHGSARWLYSSCDSEEATLSLDKFNG